MSRSGLPERDMRGSLAKCRECRFRTADLGLEDQCEGWVCRSHLPPRRTVRRTAPLKRILLELVDEDGNAIGTAEKLAHHQPPGQLHRAFSRVPLRRARQAAAPAARPGQVPLPGVWSNTCCGHPYPAEAPFAAAAPGGRYEELGVSPSLLAEAGTVHYNHPDPESGLVEQEYNHLFVGMVQSSLHPDPEEVGDTAFVTAAELMERHAKDPFSAWFLTVLDAARPAMWERADGPVRRLVTDPSSRKRPESARP